MSAMSTSPTGHTLTGADGYKCKCSSPPHLPPHMAQHHNDPARASQCASAYCIRCVCIL